MATETGSASTGAEPSGIDQVDPRAPRFGQTLTATGLLAAIALDRPAFLFAVAAVLVTAVVSRWRLDLWALLWRHVALPVVGRPTEREPAAPHRFAKLIGATGTALASAFVLAGFPLAAYVVAGGVAAAAALAATTGICLGCRMYRQVAFARRLNVV